MLTHNMCGIPCMGQLRQRAEAMCREYERLGPDILALQEVHGWGLFRFLAERLLPSMPYVSVVTSKRGPQAGLVTFSKEPIATTGDLLFSSKLRHWGRGFRKGALVCETGGVRVVNFHLSFNPWGERTSPSFFAVAQDRQVSRLIELVNELGHGRKVVVGDSNVDSGAPLHRALLAGADLTDPFEGRWPTISNRRGTRAYALDCVLTRGWEGHEAQVEPVFRGQTSMLPSMRRGKVSDHEGLWLKLTQN